MPRRARRAGWGALALLPLLSGGCQGPFSVNRHDLGPFRIAAMGVEDGVARAAVWSGEGLYHAAAPALAWTLDGAPLGEGFDVAVPESGTLGLVATGAEGQVAQGELSIAAPPASFGLARAAVALGADLSLEARAAAAEEPVDWSAAEGEAMRLRLDFGEADPAGLRTRWMTADGHGSLLELSTFAADVLAEELSWEDGALVDREPLGPGVYPQLALVQDGAGGNRWAWTDAGVGLEGDWLRHEGRLLPWPGAGAPPTEGLVALRLGAFDARLGPLPDAAEAVADLSAQDALACAPPDAPFRFAWIAEGRCALAEVEGAVVVVEVW